MSERDPHRRRSEVGATRREASPGRSSNGGRGHHSRLIRMFHRDAGRVAGELGLFRTSVSKGEAPSHRVAAVFRAVHSLKSEAAFLRLSNMQHAAERMEDELSSLSKRSQVDAIQLSDDDRERLEATIRELLDALGQQRANAAGEALIGRQPDVHGRTAAAWGAVPGDEGGEDAIAPDPSRFERAPPDTTVVGWLTENELEQLEEARNRGETVYRVDCTLSSAEPLTHARLFLLLSSLEAVANVLRSVPTAGELDSTDHVAFSALVTASVSESELHGAVYLDQVTDISIVSLDYDFLLEYAAQFSGAGQAISASGLSGLGGSGFGEKVELTLSGRSYEELRLYSDELLYELRALSERLHRGESGAACLRSARAAALLSEQVNNQIRRTALVPFAEVLQPLFSLVDQAVQCTSKLVRLDVAGGHEQLYLPVAEVLARSLLHLVRNALDHGLEDAEERRRQGKPAEARIALSVRQKSGELEVTLQDDGRGIDEEAVHRALHGEDDRDGGTLLDLVSGPGVSTVQGDAPEEESSAERASGRGIGLNAVRHSVEHLLGGTLEMENYPGRGVRFTVRLPGSTRLLTALVLRLGEQSLALPSCQVHRVLTMESEQIVRTQAGRLFYGGEAISLRLLVPVGCQVDLDAQQLRTGIVIRAGGREAVVLADEVIGEEIAVRDATTRDRIYSRLLQAEVPLFVPVQL